MVSVFAATENGTFLPSTATLRVSSSSPSSPSACARAGQVAAQRQHHADRGAAGFDVEVDGIDQEGGRGVVLEIDRLGGIRFHCLSSIGAGSADDMSKQRGRFLRGEGCK